MRAHVIGREFMLAVLSVVGEVRDEPPRSRRAWAWIGFIGLACALAFLEARQPYYFTQDDNLVCFLPVILHGGRSLFSGTFPTWNAHQFLGMPTTTTGVYALTYPPTYGAYAIARFMLGNEYLTLDVFAVLHLMAGYVVTFVTCRRLGIRSSLAMAGTLSFILCGYFLIAGRSWYYMTPVAVWLPALALLLVRFRNGHAGGPWVLGTGVVVGMFFHAGNAQMWAYGLLFFGLAIGLLMATGSIAVRRVALAASGILLGVSFALPLLFLQVFETAVARRPSGASIARGLVGIVLPWPLAKVSDPMGWGSFDYQRLGHLYYSGTVFALCGAIAAGSFVVHRWPRRIVAANWFVPLGILAVALAMGRRGFVWTVLTYVPPFDRFRWAFKFLPYVVFFLVVSGAVILEGTFRHLRLRRRWGIAICAITIGLLGYHVWMARPSFYSYGFVPYPSVPANAAALVTSFPVRRVYAVSPDRSVSPHFFQSLRHNLPTVSGAYALGGYDTFADLTSVYRFVTEAVRSERVAEALRAYGVKWIVVYRPQDNADLGPNPTRRALERINDDEAAMLERVSSVVEARLPLGPATIWVLPDPAPLAFTEDETHEELSVSFNGAGVTVDLSGRAHPGDVIVNVLWRRSWRAYVDGVAVGPIEQDGWKRVRVAVPFRARTLSLRYDPPWGLGWGLALLLVGVAAAVFVVARRAGTKRDVAPGRTTR
jgi:hypothetical protein